MFTKSWCLKTVQSVYNGQLSQSCANMSWTDKLLEGVLRQAKLAVPISSGMGDVYANYQGFSLKNKLLTNFKGQYELPSKISCLYLTNGCVIAI